jgi:hypothetical protein
MSPCLSFYFHKHAIHPAEVNSDEDSKAIAHCWKPSLPGTAL